MLSVICEHSGMAKPTTRKLVEATGISRTYAHDILSDKQPPSLPLAIEIHRLTGWKHSLIEDMSQVALDELAAALPWQRAA